MSSPIERSLPKFPGGTSVSNLCVYDWEAADGFHGGSPHLHTVSTEAYMVTRGRGEVHTISSEGAARDLLEKGSLLWFTPGTVHRLVNHGDLELSVVMSNAGLPEAGDAVLTFPAEVLADPERYRAAVALPEGNEHARALAARARRDLALAGYEELLSAVGEHGPEALERIYSLAVALIRPLVPRWQQLWEANVLAETERVRDQLGRLAEGDGSHLQQSVVVRGEPKPEPRAYGMCGRLQVWQAEGR